MSKRSSTTLGKLARQPPPRRPAKPGECVTLRVHIDPGSDSVNHLVGTGWTTSRKLLNEIKQQVGLAAMVAGSPAFQRPVVVLVIYYYSGDRPPDAPNLGKGFLDALQAAGVILGDDPASLMPWIPELVRDAKFPRIEVTIHSTEGMTADEIKALYAPVMDRIITSTLARNGR